MTHNALNLPPLHILGLMSGTSLDGVDAVLARLERRDGVLLWEVLARRSLDYPPALRGRLERALQPDTSDVVLLTQLHTEVGAVYGNIVAEVMRTERVDLVALSGQTVYHIPRVDEARGWHTLSTLQLGEAAIVSERCGVPVVSDFRPSDMAAGGGGAPLVAFGDLQLYAKPGTARAVHNLGGISNLTYLPADGDPAGVMAFDTGPANCLMDEAAKRYFGLDFDEGGRLASRGRVDEGVMTRLLNHPYLRLEPPKTTGRELFTLREFEDVLEPHAPADVLATLTAFTTESVARAYRDFVLPRPLDEILVAGGGALNPTLMRFLGERMDAPVKTFEDLGWHSKDREALAFAVVGYFASYGLPNTLPSATGARRAVVAGKLSGLTRGVLSANARAE